MTEVPLSLRGPRCTCHPPNGVTTNHANGCPLFSVYLAYQQGVSDERAAPAAGPFYAHFTVHGDASVVRDPERPSFTVVCNVPPEADDNYGRPTAERIAAVLNAQVAERAAHAGTTGGTTTDCTLPGVHEHAFRGPHRFHEWDPDAGLTDLRGAKP